MKRQKKYKLKTKKSVIKRIKITGTGKLMRSHQMRTSHLKRHKSKSALRRHAKPMQVHKTNVRQLKRLLGMN
ncbi:50S ribosomal protein L35 [Candidatus Daviesbacteria bacterium]|nr:50S ribosomal protein L35 [Candidatus Daviesbacteria bacterium]